MKRWFQFSKILFSILLILLSFSSFTEQKKLQICSITINSSQEIETFKEHLDPEKFEFIELVPQKEREVTVPTEIPSERGVIELPFDGLWQISPESNIAEQLEYEAPVSMEISTESDAMEQPRI